MKKKYTFISVAILILLFFLIFPTNTTRMTDIISGTDATDYRVEYGILRHIFEPAFGLSDYFFSFVDYRGQLLSWLLWLWFFVVLLNIKKLKHSAGGVWAPDIKGFVVANLKYITFFLLWVFFVLIFPNPAPKISSEKDFLAVNFQSHTYHSHDAVPSPRMNLKYHKRQGFGAFFITEHDNTDSYEDLMKVAARMPGYKVFPLPGLQQGTKDGISVLILGREKFFAEDFRNKTIKEIVMQARERNMSVIVPQWWRRRKPSWSELKNWGVDGFEIYNTGHREFSNEERRELIEFCKKNNLVMTAATNWHGWASYGDVWNVYEKSELASPSVEDLIFDKNGKIRQPRIIALKRFEVHSKLRIIFEPFVGLYYYFREMDIFKFFSWSFWILAFGFCSGKLKKYGRYFWYAVFVAVIYYALKYAAFYIMLYPSNRPTGQLSLFLFSIAAMVFFVVIPRKKEKKQP